MTTTLETIEARAQDISAGEHNVEHVADLVGALAAHLRCVGDDAEKSLRIRLDDALDRAKKAEAALASSHGAGGATQWHSRERDQALAELAKLRPGPPWLPELLAALGWEGGTWNAALAEVKARTAQRDRLFAESVATRAAGLATSAERRALEATRAWLDNGGGFRDFVAAVRALDAQESPGSDAPRDDGTTSGEEPGNKEKEHGSGELREVHGQAGLRGVRGVDGRQDVRREGHADLAEPAGAGAGSVERRSVGDPRGEQAQDVAAIKVGDRVRFTQAPHRDTREGVVDQVIDEDGHAVFWVRQRAPRYTCRVDLRRDGDTIERLPDAEPAPMPSAAGDVVRVVEAEGQSGPWFVVTIGDVPISGFPRSDRAEAAADRLRTAIAAHVARAVEAAVTEEREACERIARDLSGDWDEDAKRHVREHRPHSEARARGMFAAAEVVRCRIRARGAAKEGA